MSAIKLKGIRWAEEHFKEELIIGNYQQFRLSRQFIVEVQSIAGLNAGISI